MVESRYTLPITTFAASFRELPNAVKKCTVGFTAVGFLVGVMLGTYAFYLTSHQRMGDERLFIGLCPPSIGAMALDNAGVVGGVVGWLGISIENGALYGAVGFGCGSLCERTKRLLRKQSSSGHRN